MSAGGLVLAALVMALGACVQGAVGFGASLISAPLLVLIDSDLVPGPITLASLVLNVVLIVMVRDDHAIDRKVHYAMVGLVPGALVAGAALSVLDASGLAVAFALLVFLAVGLSASGLTVARTPRTLVAAGTLSGFMGTISSIGGPPIALLYQHERALVLRSTLPRYFLVASLVAVVILVPVGRLGPTEVLEGLALLPGVALGVAIAPRLSGHIDRRSARPVVLGLSVLAATAVLVKELL
jgi:uncharacterized membrane protein YfcA